MDVRKHCDDQEKLIKKHDFQLRILAEDQEFLDFELRDGKEQNATLKLALSKHLSLLDEQSFENEQARLGLQAFVENVRRGLADGDIDLLMPQQRLETLQR